jgi:hypothetical protein
MLETRSASDAPTVEDSVGIGGLEFLKPLERKCQLVMMLSGMTQEDVPLGTEV